MEDGEVLLFQFCYFPLAQGVEFLFNCDRLRRRYRATTRDRGKITHCFDDEERYALNEAKDIRLSGRGDTITPDMCERERYNAIISTAFMLFACLQTMLPSQFHMRYRDMM